MTPQFSSTRSLKSSALRLTVGVLAGLALWVAMRPVLLHLPMWVRFAVTWFMFTLGPGLALGARLTQALHPVQRTIIWLGLGSAVVPLIVELLGRTGGLRLFPFLTFALLGGGAARYRRPEQASRPWFPDLAACALIVLLAVGIGALVFAHRLIETPEGVQLYGDYDSFDLSFYASWASEATHTVPPTASFYSGHRLNAAYYPQMVLTMVHRFADVPLLRMYFGYAWPTFLALGALSAYALVRLVSPVGTSLLAAVLLLIGGDFSYLAAWLLPRQTVQWDYVLWPTNFLAPTMEVLHFNTWGPTLPLFFTALYALVRGIQVRSRGWLVASAFLTAVLFQFKPFAYIVVMAGLSGAFVFAGSDWATRRRLAAMIVLTGVFTAPLVYPIVTLGAEDRRSRLLIDFLMLPRRMLIKLDLTDAFTRVAASLAPTAEWQRPLFLVAATALFLLVGPGVRWLGAPGLWRAMRGRMASDLPAWRILAWVVVAGVAIPCVVATDPYVDTLQFYQTGLYVWWIFPAVALSSFAARHPRAGALAIAVAVAATTPSSIHYVARKWSDNQRPVMAALSRGEMSAAEYLRTQDWEATVILHDRPTAPSLLAVVSERRVVLGWGRTYYAVGSQGRVRDVNRFFGSARGSPDDAMETLRRYHVTHVIVHPDRDRVHPQVLARLTPLMAFPDVVLYGVPGE